VTNDTGSRPESALEELFYHTDRVRFVHWRGFSGAKTAVLLTGIITVVSFVTGLSLLSESTLALEGPIAGVLPDVTGFVRFSGVLFAFVLGGLSVGLQRRRRLAWYLALVVLPLVALLPLTTLRATDVPLLLLVGLAFPLLVVNREQFDRTLDLSSLQIAALLSFVGVVAYGVIGSFALRDQFVELDTWGDSVYYVIVTIATVGYGDVTPTTVESKWFSLSVIMFGTAAFTVVVGSFIAPAIEKRMASAFGEMKPSELNLLEDHVIVLGYGDFTEPLLEELDGEAEVVVVTEDTEDASALDDMDVNVLTADPTEADSLQDVSVDVARGVVTATEDDAQDVLAVLAAKQANPDIEVVAAANDHHNVEKLEQVGADVVISPTELGGMFLGRSVLDGTAPETLSEGEETPE